MFTIGTFPLSSLNIWATSCLFEARATRILVKIHDMLCPKNVHYITRNIRNSIIAFYEFYRGTMTFSKLYCCQSLFRISKYFHHMTNKSQLVSVKKEGEPCELEKPWRYPQPKEN